MSKQLMSSLIVIFIFVSCSQNNEAILQTNINTKDIKNIEAIRDLPLKENAHQYLLNVQKRDYEKEYTGLSKGYLARHFPGIENANDYMKIKNDKSEIRNMKILEIIEVVKENDNKYSIKIVFESESEGEMYKIKRTILFINESGKWKYDGFDIKNDEYL